MPVIVPELQVIHFPEGVFHNSVIIFCVCNSNNFVEEVNKVVACTGTRGLRVHAAETFNFSSYPNRPKRFQIEVCWYNACFAVVHVQLKQANGVTDTGKKLASFVLIVGANIYIIDMSYQGALISVFLPEFGIDCFAYDFRRKT